MANITETPFSDIYITPDKKAYIPDKRTSNALIRFEPEDFGVFFDLVEKTWDGVNPSYSVCYHKIFYRVERSQTISGIQYCARKMPSEIVPFNVLGYPKELVTYLMSLRKASGLILWAGPTGSGKTTSISSLLKEYLSTEGGFAYTIEDPTEQPLDGIYPVATGGLGLCRQTLPANGCWGESLKSALRSKPRYIMVGEIRTPDTASEVLRAMTSGHLVLSTIHANNVIDAIASVIKYASSSGITEDLAYDLFSRGVLGVIHQTLEGTTVKKPQISFLFANPDTTKGDQVRGIIKTGRLNLSTSIETQMTRMARGMSMFPEISGDDE